MRIVVLSRDLIIASRILDRAAAAGHDALLIGEPSALPPATSVDILFVNWGDRQETWADALRRWRSDHQAAAGRRLILFGPHKDVDAHAAARAAGLGPMRARSSLVAALRALMQG